jgi:hypothetical protein
MKDQPTQLFDAIVRIDKLPTAGRSISVDADEATRTRLAEEMKLLAVERFVADLTVAPFRGGLRAQGRLKARIIQASVVSFEPVPQNVDEAVDRVFLPVGQTAKAPAPGTEILIETLALAIDPYPRREGEDLSAIGVVATEDDSGPFAALRGLKDKGKS